MFRSRFIRGFIAFVLIGIFLLVPCDRSRFAFGNPVVLNEAIKYALLNYIVSCGVYPDNSQEAGRIVEDMWNDLSDRAKTNVHNTVAAGIVLGKVVTSNLPKIALDEWLKENVKEGQNNRAEKMGTIPYEVSSYIHYEAINLPELGQFTVAWNLEKNRFDFRLNGSVIGYRSAPNPAYWDIDHSLLSILVYHAPDTNLVRLILDVFCYNNCSINHEPDWPPFSYPNHTWQAVYAIGVGSSFSLSGATGVASATYPSVWGDNVGFSSQTETHVPPVPDTEWDPSWLRELEEELNRTANPDMDRSDAEEWDDWDYYVDKDTGQVYRTRKGTGPRRPDDPQYRPGVPWIPGIPDPPGSPGNPDETVTDYPPEIEEFPNDDGTWTRRITQDKEITRTWRDPETGRTITETTTETTTTTIRFDPETGTELGRDVTVETKPGPRTSTPSSPSPPATEINWDPLRKAVGELTWKFPFCLPWDIQRTIEGFGDSAEWPEWEVSLPFMGQTVQFVLCIPEQFRFIVTGVRVALLILFSIGLIYGTRRLLGGGV